MSVRVTDSVRDVYSYISLVMYAGAVAIQLIRMAYSVRAVSMTDSVRDLYSYISFVVHTGAVAI